mgnify:CR=1 FL=1
MLLYGFLPLCVFFSATYFKGSLKKVLISFVYSKKAVSLHRFSEKSRGVAQPGLEYASGGRVVASSNLVTPTDEKAW